MGRSSAEDTDRIPCIAARRSAGSDRCRAQGRQQEHAQGIQRVNELGRDHVGDPAQPVPEDVQRAAAHVRELGRAEERFYALPAGRVRGLAKLPATQSSVGKAGKKLDMGKSCLHFKRVEDLELDAIGKVIASFTPEQWIAVMEKSRRRG
jgi:hypothetical protein